MRRAPGPGWVSVAPGIYEHVSGIRVDMSGNLRLADQRTIRLSTAGPLHWLEWRRSLAVAGLDRRRALMIWALEVSS